MQWSKIFYTFMLLTLGIQFSSAQSCIDPSRIDTTISCTTEYQPVCGCNGVTYPNLCEAERNGVLTWFFDPCPQRKDTILNEPWVKELIDPTSEFCDSCLSISTAELDGAPVVVMIWDAGFCGFADVGFHTIYTLLGDTIQHCEITIAGPRCDPDAGIDLSTLDSLTTIWRCTPLNLPECEIASGSELSVPWVQDVILADSFLCNAICFEGNAGNFLIRHDLEQGVIFEFQTTCGDHYRNFYDCLGNLVNRCLSFDFVGSNSCDTIPFSKALDRGKLLWECNDGFEFDSTTSSHSVESVDSQIKIIPNPSFGPVAIETSQEILTVEIRNAFGKLVAKSRNTKFDFPFPGLYFLTITTPKFQITRRFVVQ